MTEVRGVMLTIETVDVFGIVQFISTAVVHSFDDVRARKCNTI